MWHQLLSKCPTDGASVASKHHYYKPHHNVYYSLVSNIVIIITSFENYLLLPGILEFTGNRHTCSVKLTSIICKSQIKYYIHFRDKEIAGLERMNMLPKTTQEANQNPCFDFIHAIIQQIFIVRVRLYARH